ncbi:hypothetical protein [Kineococcus sp. SYSU DK003]|uniref:hypothetical protein n=1 Tax=Kineococcus sp. SYSU DK003 TaxID=3383124 RepID=UPI003D7D7CCD
MNTWLLVPAEEVGLLARLRPVVRATSRGVLVALDHAPPGTQLGLGHDGVLHWFGGGFTAAEVQRLVDHVRWARFAELPAAFAHRRLAVSRS